MGELADLLPIIFIALVLWMAGLSFVFYRLLSHYRRIAGKAKGGDIIKAVEELIKLEEKNTEELGKVRKEIDAIQERLVRPLQRIGLVRYNPFNETGGDQSFSVCLLNGDLDGFIMTTLHTRDRTRVYTKSIVGGVCKHELSKEEEKALREAVN